MYKISLREILPHKFWKPSTLSHFHVFSINRNDVGSKEIYPSNSSYDALKIDCQRYCKDYYLYVPLGSQSEINLE